MTTKHPVRDRQARPPQALPGRGPSRAATALLLLALAGPGLPARADGVETLVITGSTLERRVAEAPYAIGVVDRDTLRGAGPLVNLSEALQRVPGLTVSDRGNYAQDLQISSRGFGARAGFGVRGLRLVADGIPASGPDGQGQVSHFDLASAERVEVLRGPFSVLYGAGSGGVISLVSAPVRERRGELALDFGSHGLVQRRVQGEALLADSAELRLLAQELQIDGHRPHAAAERKLLSGRLGLREGRHDLVILASRLEQPAQDPLGLTRAQFDAEPSGTSPLAVDYDTRKHTAQQQLGARWRWRPEKGALRELSLVAYGGERSITQFLAIAPAVQLNPRHGGGVIDFDRAFQGAELRLRWVLPSLSLQAGVALDEQRDDRQGYENFSGPASAPTALGVQGRLRRDEDNRARSQDLFVQAEWAASSRSLLSAGLRGGRVEMEATDRFLANGDDSGARSFRYANPVLGLNWRALGEGSDGLWLHGSVARGYETPTLLELAYRPDGSSGFNTGLQAQQSRQGELGLKWRSRRWSVDAALFAARTDNEIGVLSNAGGRAAFQNVGRTARQGLELAGQWRPAPAWQLSASGSWLSARHRDSFLACDGLPCAVASVPVPAGNRIAGTRRGQAWAEAAWSDAGWGVIAFELRHASPQVANDLNDDRSEAATLAALSWRRSLPLGGAFAGFTGEWLLRVDNLADRRHAASVIVNEASHRYFEPGAPRSVMLSLRLRLP